MSVREIQVKQVDRNIAHLRVNQGIASTVGNGGTHYSSIIVVLRVVSHAGFEDLDAYHSAEFYRGCFSSCTMILGVLLFGVCVFGVYTHTRDILL